MNTQQTVEDVLRAAGWVQCDASAIQVGEIYYHISDRSEATQYASDWPSGASVLRAPRPEPEFQIGDIRILTVSEYDPTEAVLVRSSGLIVWLPLDSKKAKWLSRLKGDLSITAIEPRPQDQAHSPSLHVTDSTDTALSASDSALTNTDDRTDDAPAQLTLADLRNNPGRIAYDHHTIEVFANPDGRITCQSTTDGEPATCGQPDTHVNLHWADTPEEGQL